MSCGHPLGHFSWIFFLFFVGLASVAAEATQAAAADRDASQIELLHHEWYADAEWTDIGKTKYFWKVTVRNHSNVRKRVFAYYYLLDKDDVPLARNVANRYVGPKQTVEILADSYIMTPYVPDVVRSRVKIKVGFPN